MAEVINLANPAVFQAELEPVAAQLLDRHLATAKEWFPHELVPYSQGNTFGKGYEWSAEESVIQDEAVSSALLVNLWTEDNLPHYYEEIENTFGRHGAFGTWNRRWTAEEGRHSIVIRDYLHATRAVDPILLERGRMAQVSGGEVPRPNSPLEGVFYVALQELATRVAHRRTGSRMPDHDGKAIMDRVANDENLHYLFYKDLGKAAIERNPSACMVALEKVVTTFTMPGTGIMDFERHSSRIALSGIYGAPEYREDVLRPTLDVQWNIDNLGGLDPAAEEARKRLRVHIRKVGMFAAQQRGQREQVKTPA
jgi:acyl-[acyl-carrier-protein] desaturase